jgi:hypothetical protein
VCEGSYLRDPLTIFSAFCLFFCFLFYGFLILVIISLAKLLLTLAYCAFLLLTLWFAVCGGSYLRDTLTIFSAFYLFFILWFQDPLPLHHLLSHIIVDIGLLFYLLFILWFAVCGGSYLRDPLILAQCIGSWIQL